MANGVLVSAFGFAVGLLLLDFRLAPSALPGLACVVVITVASCTGFGLRLGSIGLRARDVFFISNLFYFLMLLFPGSAVRRHTGVVAALMLQVSAIGMVRSGPMSSEV